MPEPKTLKAELKKESDNLPRHWGKRLLVRRIFLLCVTVNVTHTVMAANKRFATALHALAVLEYMGRQGDRFVCSEQIAASVNTNPVMIRSLFGSLRKARLVTAKEGKGGGLRLSRAASTINLYDIYRAVEAGPIFRLNDKREKKKCPVSCQMKAILGDLGGDVEEAVRKHLSGHNLAELVSKIT